MKPSPFLDANTPIKSRALNEAGRANYDKIFRKGEETIEAMHDAVAEHHKMADCPECTGRGYHIERELVQEYGRSKYEAYRKGCTTCDGTGRVTR